MSRRTATFALARAARGAALVRCGAALVAARGAARVARGAARAARGAALVAACGAALVAACGAALVACGSTGAEPFRYPLVGTGAAAQPFAVGDWQVTLTRAEVAVGPVYLCATAAASPELCAVAIGEYTDIAVIDALDPAAQPLGEVAARPGDVRSAMLDYGISWFTTATAPSPLSELEHSARLTGAADALAQAGLTHTIQPGDDAHAAIAFAMTTRPPVFRWTHP
jgi:hypothetical protein